MNNKRTTVGYIVLSVVLSILLVATIVICNAMVFHGTDPGYQP